MATLELSTTGFSRFSSCPKKYEYAEVHKLVPPYGRTSYNMRKGIWLHRALQDRYSKEDYDPLDTLNGLLDWVTERGVSEETSTQVYDECRAILAQYEDYYSKSEDKLAKAKVLATETPYFVSVPKFDAILRATVDLVAKTKRGLWVVEHKSTSEIPPANWRAVDPQTAMQLLILSQGKHYQPDGVLFNYMLTTKPTVPGITRGNKKEPPRIYANAGVTTTRCFDQTRDELVVAWQEWQEANEGGVRMAYIAAYVDEQRGKLVNDAKWFQQYEVFRPAGVLVETVKDIMGVLAAIRQCEERDHWPRAFHIHNCPTFCAYSDLCVAEYVSGKPSKEMRQTEFRIDDGEREGR